MHFTTPTLTIDLSAIVANWQMLCAKFSGEETTAVVKADAYGLGAIPVATALADVGCHSFFVATLEEAIALRGALPDVRILVFHGVQAGEEFAFRQHRLIPVLNSPAQIERWLPVARDHRNALSALHLDTAMTRLGLTTREWENYCAKGREWFEACRISLILSHLANASEPDDSRNAVQRDLFSRLSAPISGIPLSLANSAGMLLDNSYHFTLARPGCALYGIHPSGAKGDPTLLRPVASWRAPILQLRTLDHAQEVGYGGTDRAEAGARIATVASGYADGYLRSLSNQNAYGLLAGHRVAMLGRVSMDMLCFDVSAVPESLCHEGAMITLLGSDGKESITIDALAEKAGTIGYELLTRISTRVHRHYL
jgi:alanine racemase